jgi:hypothetical protein
MMIDAIDRYTGKPGTPGATDVNVAPAPHASDDHVPMSVARTETVGNSEAITAEMTGGR